MAVSAVETLAVPRRWSDVGASWRNWILCVAVANFCMVRVWVDLLAFDPWPAHRGYDAPGPVLLGAAATVTLLLGTVYWLLLRLAAFVPGGQLLRLFLSGLAGALFLKESFMTVSGMGWVQRSSILTIPGVILTLLVITVTVLAFRHYGLTLIRRGATALVPLAAITFSNAAWKSLHAQPAQSRSFNRPVRSDAPARKVRPRVVWIILDEIDEEVAFTSRPSGLSLPELDRFRREAQIVLPEAYSPANATAVSIPALLAVAPQTNIFARAKQAGLRAGVIGWAVPYCPTFQSAVEACAWWPMPQQHNTYGETWPEAVAGISESLVQSNQLSPWGQARSVRGYVRTVQEMTAAAVAMAARPDLDLVFLHMPPPHNPYVFNPKTGALDVVTTKPPNAPGYLRNLLLADRIFGQIRRSLESSGLWDRSSVIVTGDHGFRSKRLLGYNGPVEHVPFMAKTTLSIGSDRMSRFETSRTAEIILGWLNPSS